MAERERGIAGPGEVRAEALALVNELLTRLAADGVRELEVRTGDLRVKVSKGTSTDGAPGTMPDEAVRGAGPAGAPARAPTATGKASAVEVTAPLTGIFYRSPSLQAPPFVQIGSVVTVGDVVGLIEAMKLFNEVRSTVSGTVRRILVENGQLVRAHQGLFELE